MPPIYSMYWFILVNEKALRTGMMIGIQGECRRRGDGISMEAKSLDGWPYASMRHPLDSVPPLSLSVKPLPHFRILRN